MIGFLLDIAYLSVLTLASPFLLYRMIRHGRYRDDIAQRFGSVPANRGDKPTIWIHGVSLGEVNAARTLVEELHRRLGQYDVVISSSTETGMAAAKRLYSEDHIVFRWPLDFSLAVRRAIKRVKPSLVVLMEGEVWPNFLAACNTSTPPVPVVVVNARMSADKGYPGYKKLGSLAAKLFNRVTAFGVQDESYAQLYRKLGVHDDKLHVTGMMKFDTAGAADQVDGQDQLADAMSITSDDDLIVAGGTGPGEEAILLDVFAQIRKRHASARLAIVPRKPERFDEVAQLISSRGFSVLRRSQCPDGAKTGESDVILGDTMGELRKFYALAKCIFVGRSLVEMGGSDMIEAAALGKAVAFGPHTFNFPQADDLAANGCARVADADELTEQLDRWLGDIAAANSAGRQGRQYVQSQQGATARNVQMICDILDEKESLSQTPRRGR